MRSNSTHSSIRVVIILVWIINGLFCKVLSYTPRHQQIVAEILGHQYARPLTMAIGIAEIGMAIWILSGIKPRLNAIAQISIIATMNILEALLVPHLLLWGYANSLFAFMFILLIAYNEYTRTKTAMA